MKNILVISGHSDLNNSFANKTILAELNKLLPEAEYVYLDKLYLDFRIDVAREQERLLKADVIVWQFPVFWYSMPSMLHRWLEEVFVNGFSHGPTGDKLKGKKLLLSFTSGAPEEMYSHGGRQGYSIDELMPPFKQTAVLCQLEWCGYIYTGGMSYANRSDEQKLKEMHAKAIVHANRLVEELQKL